MNLNKLYTVSPVKLSSELLDNWALVMSLLVATHFCQLRSHPNGCDYSKLLTGPLNAKMIHKPIEQNRALFYFAAAKNLIACGQEKGTISASYKLYGHRDIKNTACPGIMLYNEIRKWPTYGDEFGKTEDAANENGNKDDSSDGTGETDVSGKSNFVRS